MNLGELKKNARETAQREAEEASAREKEEQRQAEERAQQEKERQEAELRAALEALSVERQRLLEFTANVGGFINQVRVAEKNKKGGHERLSATYERINRELRDDDISTEMVRLGKTIRSAEEFVADPDFADDENTVVALEAQAAIQDAITELDRLETDERELHEQIRTAVGADPDVPRPSEISAARHESALLIEAHIKKLDKDIRELEWQTPEGKEKAEGYLKEALGADMKTWTEFQGEHLLNGEREILKRMLDQDDRNPVSPEMLQIKAILGEEKFAEVTKAHYKVRLDELGDRYERRVMGEAAFDKMKRIEGMSEAIREGHKEVRDLYNERKEATRALVEFFISDEGRESLSSIIGFKISYGAYRRIVSPRLYGESRPNRIIEQSAHEERARSLESINSSEEYRRRFAEEAAASVLRSLDAAANKFSFNVGWYGSEKNPDNQTFPHGFYSALNKAEAEDRNGRMGKGYGTVTDVEELRVGIAEAQEYYKKIPAAARESKQGLMEMYALSEMIVDYEDPMNARSTFPVGDYFDKGHFAIAIQGMPSHIMRNYESVWASSDEERENWGYFEEMKKKVETMLEVVPHREVVGKDGNALSVAINLDERQREYLENIHNAVARVKALGPLEASADIVRAEMKAFEETPEFADAKSFSMIERKKIFSRGIEWNMGNIALGVEQYADALIEFSDDMLVPKDLEGNRLNQKITSLGRTINEKDETLRRLKNDPPKGMFSGGDKKRWAANIEKLEKEISGHETDKQSTQAQFWGRKKFQKALPEMQEVLADIKKRFSEEYAQAEFKSATAGELLSKMQAFQQSFSEGSPSEKEVVANQVYQTLVQRSRRANEALERQRSDVIYNTDRVLHHGIRS